MSDPSGTQFLSGLLNLGKTSQATQPPASKPFDTGDVIRLLNQAAQQKFGPEAQKNQYTQNDRRTEGEVLQKNRDGSYRLRVQDSEVDVRLTPSANQSILKAGQRLLIDIIPNTQNLSALPSVKISLASQISAQAQIQDTRLSATPLNLELSGKADQQTLPQNTLQSVLSPGKEVRFLPISSSAQIIVPPSQTQNTQLPLQSLFASIQGASSSSVTPALQASIQSLTQISIPVQQNGVLHGFLSDLAHSPLPPQSQVTAPPSPPAPPIVQTSLNTQILQNGASLSLNLPLRPSPSNSGTLLSPPSQLIQNPGLTGQALQGRVQNLQLGTIMLNPTDNQAAQPPRTTGNAPNPSLPPLINQAAANTHTPGAQLGHITMQLVGLSEKHTPIFQSVQSNSFYATSLSTGQSYTVPTPINPAEAQIGSQISISPTTQTLSADGIRAVDLSLPPSVGFMISPGIWPSMQLLQNSLPAPAAAQGAQAFSSLIPNAAAPSNIPQAALFFIAAIRAGDISGWLGEKNTEMLRQSGRGNLLNRLTQEGGLLNRLATDSGGSDWRTMSLPMAWQNEVHKITLRYRQEEHESHDGEDNKNNTRFIMDLSLSNMGELQLDGLYRPGHLDVIMRSENNFGEAMRMSMKQLYIKSLEQTDLKGELLFQHTKKNWVQIKPTKDQLSWSA